MIKHFIKPDVPLNVCYSGRNYAPMFRKCFSLKQFEKAELSICGLGIAYCWINGHPISHDLFTAPLSNYNKTVWYCTYNVSGLLNVGENVIAVWCGNGWYNEDFKSSWSFNNASWRDVPKVSAELTLDGRSVLITDSTWKVLPETAIRFNDLRSGETFDDRLYDPEWNSIDFDDSAWQMAIEDMNSPKGVMRACSCEPIREFESYSPLTVLKTGDNKWLYDFGQNISGYIRLTAAGYPGQTIKIRYAEQIKSDNTLELNDMKKHYPESEFQTDRLIFSGRKIEWSPRFAYHGFRYVEIDGIDAQNIISIESVFVHQAVNTRSYFSCSDDLLNKMFNAGIISTWSNMFYQMTDCPTREKLGWTNDAQSSADQILTDFKAEKVLEKWHQDILDAMRDDGALPGIIPTAGWGYEWGNGPVSDGVLFEIPYQIYKHTGQEKLLVESILFFERYIKYLDSKRDDDGFIRFGLPDWAKPGFDQEAANDHVPVEFINALLLSRFYRITALSLDLRGECSNEYRAAEKREIKRVQNRYINSDGQCSIKHMTAVCMLIYYGAYAELGPIKNQLRDMLIERNYCHDCGMVGMRRLLYALNICTMQEEAYKILTADNPHGYRNWFENGATTLWETWNCERHEESKNHHMYSSFMTWLIDTVVGIKQTDSSVGFEEVCVEPFYLSNLTYAEGSRDTVKGTISVRWERNGKDILLKVSVPDKIKVYYHGSLLPTGMNEIRAEEG